MDNVYYGDSYAEVLAILLIVSTDELENIPIKYIEFMESNASEDCNFKYDIGLSFDKQDISESAKDILSVIYEEFLSNSSNDDQEKLKRLDEVFCRNGYVDSEIIKVDDSNDGISKNALSSENRQNNNYCDSETNDFENDSEISDFKNNDSEIDCEDDEKEEDENVAEVDEEYDDNCEDVSEVNESEVSEDEFNDEDDDISEDIDEYEDRTIYTQLSKNMMIMVVKKEFILKKGIKKICNMFKSIFSIKR